MKESESPFKMDSYKSRTERLSFLNRPDNLYAKTWFANLAVAGFVFCDLYCLKDVWNLVQMADQIFVWCLAAACAFALDVPLAIAGYVVKRYVQGLCDKKEMRLVFSLAVAVFALAWVCSFGFRLVTRDLTFSVDSGGTLVNTMAGAAETEQTDAESQAVFVAALFNAVDPLLTSISSFVVCYFSYEPLKMRIMDLQQEQAGLEAHITETEQILTEAEGEMAHRDELLAREKDLYHAHIESLEQDGRVMKQRVRLLALQNAGTAEEASQAVDDAQAAASERIDEEPFPELPDCLKKLRAAAAAPEEEPRITEVTPAQDKDTDKNAGEDTDEKKENIA